MDDAQPTPSTPTSNLDTLLRPSNWDDYIGQESIKQNLRILLDASRSRGDNPEHLLFYGPPGLGKTTLSYLIAKEIGAQIKITSGPAIDKVSDLASILTNLGEGDVLFIDEIHRLNKSIEEVLYPAMENGTLDIIIGKGPSARTVQGGVHRLELYNQEDISEIIRNSSRVLGVEIDEAAARAIACRARSTPRTANFLLKRCRDMAQLDETTITPEVVRRTMQMQGVDELGLSEIDRELLRVMIEKFKGGPVGLSTIAAAISEDPSTIEEVYEPYLMQQGLIHKTPRGREVTQAAREHLGLE
jgi:Holliday junction DNA helicase RuvB